MKKQKETVLSQSKQVRVFVGFFVLTKKSKQIFRTEKSEEMTDETEKALHEEIARLDQTGKTRFIHFLFSLKS